METEPTPKVKNFIKRSEKYFNKNKRNYWQALIEFEKTMGQRYIGGSDTISLIASFAPRGFNEVQFIFKISVRSLN